MIMTTCRTAIDLLITLIVDYKVYRVMLGVVIICSQSENMLHIAEVLTSCSICHVLCKDGRNKAPHDEVVRATCMVPPSGNSEGFGEVPVSPTVVFSIFTQKSGGD